ncbi:MAG: hypothetical protein AAFO80_08575 [Pseudomonadota bacterium]
MDVTTGIEDQILTRLEAAERHFGHALETFEAYVAAAKRGDKVDPADIHKIAKSYQASLQTLLELWGKAEDESRRRHGIVHDYAVDLGVAETEVRRLLDCLRTEGPDGAVSGGA